MEGSVAESRAGDKADPDDVAAVRMLAAALQDDGELPADRPPPLEDGTPARRAVRHGVRLVWNVVGDPEERAGAAAVRPSVDLRTRLRDLSDRTLASPDGRAFAVRLALCMSIAEVARQFLPTGRPYWVLLTVAIVLKPDFGSVFGRAIQRGAGTLLGVLIGSALLSLFPRSPLAARGDGPVRGGAAVGAGGQLRPVLGVPDAGDHPDARPGPPRRHRARARAADRHPHRLRHRPGLRLPAVAADLAGAAGPGTARRRTRARRLRRRRLHRQPGRPAPRPPSQLPRAHRTADPAAAPAGRAAADQQPRRRLVAGDRAAGTHVGRRHRGGHRHPRGRARPPTWPRWPSCGGRSAGWRTTSAAPGRPTTRRSTPRACSPRSPARWTPPGAL